MPREWASARNTAETIDAVDESTETSSIRLTRWDIARRVLAVLLPVIVVATAVSATIEIQTIAGWFPASSLAAFVLAFAVLPLRSVAAILFTLSVPLGTAGCSMAIALQQWSPQEAQVPISIAWWLFTVVHLGLAVAGNQAIWQQTATQWANSPFRWQFQIRSILILMATLSVGLALCSRLLSAYDSPFYIFACFSAGILLVTGITFSLFVSNLQAKESEPAGNPWQTPPGEPATEHIHP